jgi:ABC-type phosphate transport system substrate-binding protein
MRLPSVRRLAPACIIGAAATAALVAPGAADATLGAQCSGTGITAQGSSLQKDVQLNVWNPQFNESKSKAACAELKGQGKGKPKVEYKSTGSGAGLESWGVNKATPNYVANAFVGTDEPPNAAQKKEIESHESKSTPETVESIPVAQESVAVMVNLPANCVATSKAAKGRLVLNNVTLESIFRGPPKKWSEITESGDKLSGSGCSTTATIQPVVRKDQSGTTHIFKKYLSLINEGVFTTEAPKEESKTWTEVSEGTENTTWPKAAKVEKPEATGGGAEINWVAEHPGTIGYANIAEVRANGNFTSTKGEGPEKQRFWVELQDNGVATTGKLKYADPSLNKDVATEDEANCKDTEYTNGSVAFPPESVLEEWNEVTTRTIEPKYTLCGLTYDLAFTSYSAYTGPVIGEATTVQNYLSFVLNAAGGGGQKVMAKHDYLALPKGKVLTEAEHGVEPAHIEGGKTVGIGF